MSETRFWLIWSPTGPTPPRRRIDTRAEAKRIAEDMAQRHPGQRFYVLRAECVSVKHDVLTVNLGPAPVCTGGDDDIPF